MKPVKKPATKTKASAPAKKSTAAPKAAASKSVAPAKAKVSTGSKSKSATVAAPPVKSPKSVKKLSIPSILLEGDAPAPASVGGPGQRYALGPGTPLDHPFANTEAGELPEAYGTQRLLLTARDPQWLYAHWDFTQQQLREANALSKDKHLIVRVYRGEPSGKPMSETHVHPESRNWFIHVGHAGARYTATLGYYTTAGRWTTLSTSHSTVTPPDSLSDDTSVRFATIPVDIPFHQLLTLLKSAVPESPTLVEAIQQLRETGHSVLPAPTAFAETVWTAAQETALAAVVSMDAVRRVWMGSLEITELLRRKLVQELASVAAAEFSKPSGAGVGGGLSSISSPHGGGSGGAKGGKEFWFNVNAELIIYG
ncbi:MAG TPA: DUF4912 domain-containing protein, partial [Roseimicrobium sp.]|nr:DUF4912 domain-containing protein [Roseimicrobium sp.]